MKNTHGGHDLTSESEERSQTYPFHRLEVLYSWLTDSPSAAEPACKTMQRSAAELEVSEAESKALSATELYLRRPNLHFVPLVFSLQNLNPFL